MKKKALITGITGQDGAYLAKLLLDKGYKVYGTYRRTSTPNFWRLEWLGITSKIELVPFDLLDQTSIIDALKIAKPNEVYNLAAQSYVGASFEQPVATGEITGLGLTRVLDSIRVIDPEIRFYQASTSEMFGNSKESPQTLNTPFEPSSPYAAAKLYAHEVTKNYRDAYGLFACAGILFNHESPLRGIEFVTRKITYTMAGIKLGVFDSISLGNIHAKRDWGYAPDYVEGMWLMLQQSIPQEYILATGKSHSVLEFLQLTSEILNINYENYINIDENLLRPTDVNYLLGDPSKAQKELKWEPNRTSFEKLVEIMVEADIQNIKSGNIFNYNQVKLISQFRE